MRISKLYFLLGISWVSCVLGENTKSATRFTTRSLQDANATIVDEVVLTNETLAVTEPVVEVIAAKSHHDYSSKDFEFVSTRPSSKGSKRSGKGHGKGSSSSKGGYRMSGIGSYSHGSSRSGRHGGKKKKDTIITAQPTIMDAPSASPSQRPTSVNEQVFVLENIMLFYIPADGVIRLPTTLENAQLLELTRSYIDWCFKNEYPDTALTDLRQVITDFAGMNFIVEGEAIEKQFQPKVVFANSEETPTREELTDTLHLIFNDDHLEFYMEWLNGPYPPPPDTATGELSNDNIFKGAHVYNQRPTIVAASEGSRGNSYTNVMLAAAATGFTLFVCGVLISNHSRDGGGPIMEVKDLEKQEGQGVDTVAGETMTMASGQANDISPLPTYMSRGAEDDQRQSAQDDKLLLPSWGADRMTIDEESMEEVSISTDASSHRNEEDERASEAWSQDKTEITNEIIETEGSETIDEVVEIADDKSEISHEVINLEEVEDRFAAQEEQAPEKATDEAELQERAHVDKLAVSEWRRQRGSEAEVIELLDIDSFDSLEEPYSDSSSSSQTSESLQRPKSIGELAAMLSSQLPSERDNESKEQKTEPVIGELSDKPRTVREMSKLFSIGSM